MGQDSRLTAWLTGIERKALDDRATAENCTLNFLVREAIRQYLGKDALKAAAEDLTAVTSNK